MDDAAVLLLGYTWIWGALVLTILTGHWLELCGALVVVIPLLELWRTEP